MVLLKKRLTGFDLKIIGIVFMVFDHVHQMFVFEGVIPSWFTMVGRIVAPIFLFLSAEGFHYTRSRKRYMFTLLLGFWICTIIFQSISSVFPNSKIVLINSIFGTIFLGVALMWIYEGLFGSEKYIGKSLTALLAIVAIAILSFIMPTNLDTPALLMYALFLIPSPFIVEGGIIMPIVALLFYIGRKRNWVTYVPLALISLLMFVQDSRDVQWMMVFALIPIYLYNGREGRKEKWFFYIFYPAHIVILYVVSTLLFPH